ncbi:MAG: heme/hemin ABC transporter substrate-binding protein [Ostreibacterium sp.]
MKAQSISYYLPLAIFLIVTPSAFAYERIVSTTGNASEIIADIGLSDKLIAVDSTSIIPKAIMQNKPKIGYKRHLSSEGILSMQPDLLILAPDAGPPAVIKQIQEINVETLTLSNKKSINGVIANIRLIANKLNANQAATPLIKKLRDEKKQIQALMTNYPRTPNIVFLMDGGTGQNRLMALGKDTAGDAIIHIIGGKNVFAKDFSSIKAVSVESMINTKMDMIIIAAYNKDNLNTMAIKNATTTYQNLALTKAAKKHCIFSIDTMRALGFGPTVSQAAKEIAGLVKNCVTD